MHLFLFFIQLNFDRVALMSSFNVFFYGRDYISFHLVFHLCVSELDKSI